MTIKSRLEALEAQQPPVKGFLTFWIDATSGSDGLRRDSSGTVITDDEVERLQADGYHIIEVHYVDEVLPHDDQITA